MTDVSWMLAHCAPDRVESEIDQPFVEAGRTCATEGHYLVSIPGEWTDRRRSVGLTFSLDIPEGEHAEVIDLAPLVGVDVTEACPDCKGTLSVRCGECDGVGEHECGCGDEHECGECDGKGQQPCDCEGGRSRRTGWRAAVAGLVFDVVYLALLAPHLTGPLRVWRCLADKAILLVSEDDTRAVIMAVSYVVRADPLRVAMRRFSESS